VSMRTTSVGVRRGARERMLGEVLHRNSERGPIFAHGFWNIARHPFVPVNWNTMKDWWIAKDFAVVTPKR
jgi:hypothetical protein